MVDEGCYKCVKYLMFFFNALFLIAGFALVGIGIWLRVDPNGIKQYVDSDESFQGIYAAAYGIIVVGAIVVFISFLGCCGAIKESPCLLGCFFALILLVFLILLIIGIVIIVGRDSVNTLTTEVLQNDVNNWNKATTDDERKALLGSLLDVVQTNFKCCGCTKGRADFTVFDGPKSCEIANYLEPCANKLSEWLGEHILIVPGVIFGVAVILIFGMVFSMILCCAVRKALRYST